MPSPQVTRQRIPVSIALGYIAFGVVWILFSDGLVEGIPETSPATMARLQTLKGMVFVALTGVLIWWLARRGMGAVNEAEQAPQESESRYRQIFEKSTSVCLLVDVESTQLVDVNPAAVLFYGWSREELIGKSLEEIDTLPEPEVRRAIDSARLERRNFFIFRPRLRCGSLRDVEVHSSPIVLNGRPTLFSIVHDITDRVRAKNRTLPDYGQPAIVMDVLEEPNFDPSDRSRSPYFRELLDLLLGVLTRDDNFLLLHFDARRFEPACD